MPFRLKKHTQQFMLYVVKVQIHTNFLILGGKGNKAEKGIKDGFNFSAIFAFFKKKNQTNIAKLHLLIWVVSTQVFVTLFSILCIAKITE